MKYIILALKGFAYGTTHIAPGLGGGLILILLGIYDQLVDTVGNLLDLRRWRQHLAFLVPLGVGMVIGMIVLSRIFTVALDRFPAATYVFFMGLLIGTIRSVLRMYHDMRPTVGRVAALLVGLLIVVGLRSIKPRGLGGVEAISTVRGAAYNLFVCFLGGGASVTPGLDGSYMMLLGGTYEAIIDAIADLTHLTIHWLPLISTGVGAVAGMMVFSKLIHTALHRAPAVSAYVVLGLVLGSIYGLWPREPANVGIPVLALVFLAGLALALLLGRSGERIEGPAEAQATPGVLGGQS